MAQRTAAMIDNTLRFSDVYAASRQRKALDAGAPHARFLRDLRLDTLLSEQVVIPDTYLLDGGFFLQVTPDRLVSLLGRSGSGQKPALVIRCRKPSIQESLRWLLVDPNNPHGRLNGFPFNAIADASIRDELAASLANTTTSEYLQAVGPAQDVSSALAAFLRGRLALRGLQADEDIDRLEAGWSRWLGSEKPLSATNDLKIAAWTTKMPLADVASDERYRLDEEKDLHSQRGRVLYHQVSHEVQAGSTLRSSVMLRPRYLKDFAENEKEKADADKVLAWYDGIRHRAIARQHGCTSFAHDSSQGPPIGPLEQQAVEIARSGAPRDKEIVVPEDFYSKLMSIDDEAYGRLVVAASSDLQGWWRHGSSDSLKHVIDRVLTADAQAKQRGEGLCEVFGYVTQGAITAAIPQPVGAVAGVVAKVLVTRGAKGLIRAESNQRVVEYLFDQHVAYKP